MLDYVYGLLDAPDAEAIRAHVASCSDCTATLADADRTQVLLRRAAKMSFDDVHFETPIAEPAKPAKSSAKTWLPWVIAAGVLIAVGGLGVPFLGSKSGGGNDQAALSTEDPKKASATPIPPRTFPDLRENAGKEWSSEKNAKSSYRLSVFGPEKPTKNANNLYSITASDPTGKPLDDIRITVVVRDSKDGNHFKESFPTPAKLTLPASMWEKLPAEGVTMTVTATHPTSGDKITLAIKLQ
jgi:hypothetical protein